MRIRFSLRTLLILMTLATFVLGFRFGQRRSLRYAVLEIEKSGGEVFFRWQGPYLVSVPVPDPFFLREIEVPYTEVGPNGEQVTGTKTRMLALRTSYEYRRKTFTPPKFSVTGFLLGSHDDLDVEAVSLPVTSVDDDTAKILHRLHNLKTVLLLPRGTSENRRAPSQTLRQYLEQATTTLKSSLPGVAVRPRSD